MIMLSKFILTKSFSDSSMWELDGNDYTRPQKCVHLFPLIDAYESIKDYLPFTVLFGNAEGKISRYSIKEYNVISILVW